MTVGKDSMDEAVAPTISIEWIGGGRTRLKGELTVDGLAGSQAQYRTRDLAEIQRLVFTSA
ncbi:hypothetical protein V1279_002630 [Bradyrhizobium sp. AZCC 1610]|uniref:hypothetical protein n=1 Tax=Bradyrhizobium sp. AZCC 1610 TaxID=3117020 RepID=UPI002FF2AE66